MTRHYLPLLIVGVFVAGCRQGADTNANGPGASPGAGVPGIAEPSTRAAPAAGGAPAMETTRAFAGWYLIHGGSARFQPCGSDAGWPIGEDADLAERARAFGLEPDTPVYARVQGTLHGGTLDVAAVTQFGSPAPVRDCAMNGVVTQQ